MHIACKPINAVVMKNDFSALDTAQDTTCVTKCLSKFKDILPFYLYFYIALYCFICYIYLRKDISLTFIMNCVCYFSLFVIFLAKIFTLRF